METKAIREALALLGQTRTDDLGAVDRVMRAAESELAALTTLPEDVERDYKEVLRVVVGATGMTDGVGARALSRLAAAAARVPGLEAEFEDLNASYAQQEEQLRQVEAKWHETAEQATRAESERDAARQEAEKHRKGLQDVLLECSNFREENARLTARVAELEDLLRLPENKARARWLKASRDNHSRAESFKAKAGELDERVREAEARATAAESALKEVRRILGAGDVESAEGAAMRVAKKAGLREGSTSTLFTAPTPAPGLREAVGPLVPILWEALARESSGMLAFYSPASEVRAILAAYDAIPAATSCTCAGEGTCAWCDAKVASEPSVTHAALAAVVEDAEEHCKPLADQNPPTSPYGDGYLDALNDLKKEVLRRVTGGEVPEEDRTLRHLHATQRKAKQWDAAVGRTKDEDAAACALLGIPTFKGSGMPPSHKASWRVKAQTFARWLLGLTLPTGPGGGEPVGQEPDTFSQAFSQGVLQAIEEAQTGVRLPDVAHIGPGSEVAETMRDAYDDLHQQISEQRARIDAARAEAKAHPEPAAPEVVWEGEGVRVLADGTAEVHVGGTEWAGHRHGGVKQLARALAEAKRERDEYADVARRALASAVVKAAQLAAQDMRERAVQELVRHTSERCDCDGTEFCLRNAREAIRALPLE